MLHGCGDAAVNMELPVVEFCKRCGRRMLQGEPHGDYARERDCSEGLGWIFF